MNHPWEKTVGPGPYKFIRIVTIHQSETRGVMVSDDCADITAGIGTCTHCGMGIMNCYIVQRGDGKRFGVGSDCITKINAYSPDLANAVNAKIRAANRDKRAARAAAAKQEVAETLEKRRPELAARPHPNAFWAANGKTFADYVDFGLRCFGAAGIIRLRKEIRA